MLSVHFLLDLAIILLSTKAMGLLTRKFQMPQVVGALLAGLILGPAVLGIIHENDFIDKMAELGVIVLMFTAGMETDLKELKKCGKASFIIAMAGVLVPLAGGFGAAMLFNKGQALTGAGASIILQNVFIGVVLTATSVSITVETLQEIGKLKTPSGTAILGAAIIDDIIGIVALTFITSFVDTSVSITRIFLNVGLFFGLSVAAGIIFYRLFNWLSKQNGQKRRIPIFAFALCLMMSYAAEHFFGIADITGAFIAGIIISGTMHSEYIGRRFEITSYLLLSPIFFASVGIKTVIHSMNTQLLIFTALLLIVAIVSKIIGCGLGAKICRYKNAEALQIGVGMVSRGEVALIVANKGAAVGLMPDVFFAPLIIVIVVTTFITPILLKMVYSSKTGGSRGMPEEVKAA